MKKNLLIISTSSLLALTLAMFTNERLIYLSALFMAAAVIIVLRYFRILDRKLTRWANENPRKAQVFITVLQVIILSVGLVVGYDLKQLDYTLSDGTALVFGVVMIMGFLSVPFLPRKKVITLPVNLFKDRIAYTCIIISAYVLTVFIGNRVDDKYPDSILADVLRSVDQKIFVEEIMPGDESYQDFDVSHSLKKDETPGPLSFASFIVTGQGNNEPVLSDREAKAKLKAEKATEKLEKKQKRMTKRIEKLRKAFAAGGTGGSVGLIILLCLTLCCGICLIVGGFSGGQAGAVILGVVVAGASIWGIVSVSKKRKAYKKAIKETSS